MKKKSAALIMGILASAMVLSGCQASKGLETDNLKITQYKGVEVAQVEKPAEATDEEVEAQIQSVLEAQAETKEITDRPVQDGDNITVDFVGKIDGVEFDGGSAEDSPITVGAGGYIDGFVESMVGHSIGETYDWEGAFPEDYNNADYAGKDVVFTITIKSISESILPELNDEFVKSVSEESTTVDEYKEEVKESLAESAESSYEQELATSVWNAVLENATVEKYSEEEIKELTEPVIEQYKAAAEAQGMEYEAFLEQMGGTEEQLEELLDEQAKESLKQKMVVEAIAEKEKIEASDKEYEEQVEQIAKTYGYEDAEALKEAVEEEDLKEIVQFNLVQEWLVEHCIQKAE